MSTIKTGSKPYTYTIERSAVGITLLGMMEIRRFENGEYIRYQMVKKENKMIFDVTANTCKDPVCLRYEPLGDPFRQVDYGDLYLSWAEREIKNE
jgi:hypothetical protein